MLPKANKVQRTCEYCGTVFEAKASRVLRGDGRFCSRTCAAAARRQWIKCTCDYCGEVFEVPPHKASRRFCSRQCAGLARQTRVTRDCAQCGKPFMTQLAWIRKGGGQYCSRACADNARRQKVERTCESCGKTFWVKPSHLVKSPNNGRWCSMACYGVAQRQERMLTLRTYIRENSIINPETGCWDWQRTRLEAGYGIAAFDGRTWLAHRLSAHAFFGFDLNSPLLICHHCDRPSCTNPEHLFAGTAKDNSQDMMRKGRHHSQRAA